jgi:Xaa-Pro aminopeptidase
MWHYWQRAADLGVEPSFKPFFGIARSDAAKARFGADDKVIRPGDMLRCDVGIKYLRLNSDHQQAAYVLGPGETDAPEGLTRLMHECTRLQDVYLSEFREGLTGNQMLKNMLERARREGIPGAKIYSHSLGFFLHEPGPLIGLPWEQVACPGRGDVKLTEGNAFTMELGVGGPVPEWGGTEIRIGREEDVVFVNGACRLIDGRQTELYLI